MFCLTRRQFIWLCENAVAARRDYVPPFSAVYFDSETGMLKRRFMDGTETPEIDPPHCEPPQLMVVAGPNGSGKSTISAGLPIPGLYSNADDMKHMLGCRDLEAAQMVEKVRLLSLWKRTDFSFETVLSTARYLNLLQQAKVAGYQIAALFVLTRDPEINVSRVRARAAAGGHDVPEEKIRSRYQRSLANLPALAEIADLLRVVDNSGDAPELIYEVSDAGRQIFENQHWSNSEILNFVG